MLSWAFRYRPNGLCVAWAEPKAMPGSDLTRVKLAHPALRPLRQRLLYRTLEIHSPPFLPRRLGRIGAELGAGAPEVAIEQRVPEAHSGVIDAERVEHGSRRAAQPKRARR